MPSFDNKVDMVHMAGLTYISGSSHGRGSSQVYARK